MNDIRKYSRPWTFPRVLSLVCICITSILMMNVLAAKSKPIVLRLTENQPDSNPVTQAMRKFSHLVKVYSNNEIIVQVFAGGQLGQEPENIEQVQFGIVDFARVNSVVLANVSPSMGVVTLPYIFRDYAHKYRVLDGKVGDEIRTDLNDYGLIAFPFLDAGTRSFYTVADKPITKIEDLAGLKIRVQPAPISIRMVELLGAIPTPLNSGEVYSSLQTGVIDGAENDFVSYFLSGHSSIATNYIMNGHLSAPAVLLMNKRRFDSLTEDQQSLITKAATEAAHFERALMKKANQEAAETVRAAGTVISIIDNEPFRTAVEPIYDEFTELWPLVQKIRAVE